MAKIDVIMPQMGESIAEGTLSRWIKKVGDPIKRDEPIFEISTDKVDAEIPAPSAGVLAEILVQEGQTVAVQTVVARIDTDASAGRHGKTTPGRTACGSPRCSEPGGLRQCFSRPAHSSPRQGAPEPGPERAGPGARPFEGNPRSGHSSCRSGIARGERRDWRQRGGRNHRGAPAAQVDPPGPQDGGGAQRRYQRRLGHRLGRPSHQERHPGVHRRRGSGAAGRRGSPAAPGASAERAVAAPPPRGPALRCRRQRPSIPGLAIGWSRGPESGSSPPTTW